MQLGDLRRLAEDILRNLSGLEQYFEELLREARRSYLAGKLWEIYEFVRDNAVSWYGSLSEIYVLASPGSKRGKYTFSPYKIEPGDLLYAKQVAKREEDIRLKTFKEFESIIDNLAKSISEGKLDDMLDETPEAILYRAME